MPGSSTIPNNITEKREDAFKSFNSYQASPKFSNKKNEKSRKPLPAIELMTRGNPVNAVNSINSVELNETPNYEFRYVVIGQDDAGQDKLIKSKQVGCRVFSPSKTDIFRHTMTIDEKNVDILATIQCHDSSNANEMPAIATDDNAIFFLFDANKAEDFNNLSNYIRTLNIPQHLLKVIVGTKIGDIDKYSDLECEILDGTLTRAENFAKKNNMQYLEVDANEMSAANLFTAATQQLLFQQSLKETIAKRNEVIAKIDKFISNCENKPAKRNSNFFKNTHIQVVAAAKALRLALLSNECYIDYIKLKEDHLKSLPRNKKFHDIYQFALPILINLELMQLQNYRITALDKNLAMGF